MTLNIIPIRKFLHSLYVRNDILQDDFDHFTHKCQIYNNHIQKQLNQPETNIVANVLQNFLGHSFGYDAELFNNNDLVIMHEKQIQVIFECKKPSSNDMISDEHYNKKSFHQAIHYFMGARRDPSGLENIHIKHIIITDFIEWYVFDAREFEEIFYNSDEFQQIYVEYANPNLLGRHTTDEIYDKIRQFLTKNNPEITATKFTLKNFENQPPADQRAIFKLLHPDALLKKFNPNDANSLDKKFYAELLYIMGLKEVYSDGKLVIKPADAKGEVQLGSIYQLCLKRLKILQRGHTPDDIIQLIIIWLNRILFLKLLESQLVSWGHEKFLRIDKIANFDACNNLFFDILAIKHDARVGDKMVDIPYLNSALFEVQPAEIAAGTMFSDLDSTSKMEYYSKTILRNGDKNKTLRTGFAPILAYFFEFLDAFDFANNKTDGVVAETRTIINASVLGLIFEKINGYQDGSYFTPSFITEYMARESLHKLVVDKVNRHYGRNFQTLQDIRNGMQYDSTDDYIQMNKIINSITICDPAVGSGHFLVSALNELIYIKGYLGIILDEQNDAIRDYDFNIYNDELVLTNKHDSSFFTYKPKDAASKRIYN